MTKPFWSWTKLHTLARLSGVRRRRADMRGSHRRACHVFSPEVLEPRVLLDGTGLLQPVNLDQDAIIDGEFLEAEIPSVAVIDDAMLEATAAAEDTTSATDQTPTDQTPTDQLTPEPIRISVGNAGAIEGEDLVFTISLSAPSREQVTVRYWTENATAQTVPVDWAAREQAGAAIGGSGRDYVAQEGTIVFAPGETVREVVVATVTDDLEEPVEHFWLKYETRGLSGGLSQSSQSENGTVPFAEDTLVTDSAMGAIFDNDTEPRVSVRTFGTTDDGLPVFAVSLSNPYRETVTVEYAIQGGLPGAETSSIEVARGTVTFAPGQQFQQLPVTLPHGKLMPRTCDYQIELSNPARATLATAAAETLSVASIRVATPPTGTTVQTPAARPSSPPPSPRRCCPASSTRSSRCQPTRSSRCRATRPTTMRRPRA